MIYDNSLMKSLFCVLTFVCFPVLAHAQTVNANSLVFADPSLGVNSDNTVLYRSDLAPDHTRLRLQLGDEESALFEVGYPYYLNGQWRNLFTLDGYGNGYFRGTVSFDGNLVLGSSTGNKQIFTWSGTDNNWRLGMSEAPGFNRSLTTSHTQYLTYFNGPGQGFAIGVNSGLSSFEILAQNHYAFFRGNVGIGTTPSAAAKLQVAGGEIHLDSDQALRGGGKWLISGNPSMVTVGTTNPGVHLKLDAGASNRIFINGSTGNVGIGTASPNELLTVNGKIYGKEVKVDLNVPAPDYVFEKSYELRSLDKVQQYIEENKHLPEVPSAKDMEKNGVDVGEMEMILLKKIEELTLYMLQLKNENVEQKHLIESLRSEVEEMKSKITR